MPSVPSAPGATVHRKFTTRAFATGVPSTLSGTPVVSIYKDGSTTQSVAGVTLTVDFDAVTGLNHVAIDTSADGTFYSAGSHFELVITTGTTGGSSVVGYVVSDFDLAVANAPVNVVQILGTTLTETAGQIAAGFKKFFDIASPTSTMNLITTVTTTTNLTNLPSIPANWLTAAGIAAAALNGKGDWLTAAGTLAHVTLVDTVTTYTGNTPQTGDNFARIGALGAGLTALAPSATALSNVQWTNAKAAFIDAAISSRSTYAGGAVASVTAGVTVTTNNDKTGYTLALATVLSSPRELTSVADGAITYNDALWAAIGAGAGKKDASSGTSYIVSTPFTGTVLRTYAMTLISPPATVPDKIS